MATETPAESVKFESDDKSKKAVSSPPKEEPVTVMEIAKSAPDPSRPKYGKVRVIVSASPNGDTRPIKLPDPDHPERGSKIVIPRLVETEIDERSLCRLRRMMKIIHKPVYSKDPDKGRVIVGHRNEEIPLAHCIVLSGEPK